ncbi:Type II secretory pathway, ATPase PulE/Tfp pilus assembly pathway, ATPase PilB [Methylomonas albis]|uniref:Flp pilus assembly complex ATPase component TadA n=1 Tax=Methylomonas albis TaxID=1854563 RepID=A0ABR9D2D1_9GAMM|nr:GspE/PulE family protein [Methylomonas albis]MBD9357115.1 Flp pilus assembly complex ATPase component TadA [Methylomonas albis]CAD6880333.1 Type II secretory pathway, ATPase PulE/Tfp pilus assembly pathway, ATPase PilB [Methylomonas albis]
MREEHKSEDRKLDINQVVKWLQEDGMLSAKDVEKCRQYAVAKININKHPLKVLAECELTDQGQLGNLLTQEDLTQWLAKKLTMPYYYFDPLKIDVPTVTALFSKAYAGNYNILPIKIDADEIVVATAEPFIRAWQLDLAKMHQGKIRCVFSNPDEIKRYLDEFYNFSKSLKGAQTHNDGRAAEGQNFEQLVELSKSADLDANNQHVVNLVNWLLQYAFDQRASDIHIEPRRQQGNVRFRIDGILHNVYQLPMPIMNAVLSRLKILGRMNIAEKRLPQDGRIKTQNSNGKEIELRLSTMPTAFGEKLVMRIFDPEVLLRDYEQLGFNKQELATWNRMTSQTHGIILVTGPTGSGKTTTLYSTLKRLATSEINLCTVEDPIEQIVPAFNQMQTQANIGLDFASGIRTLLRQDPDIIMVGEIRDLETAEMAVQASLTGHLVISTLHTNSAPAAVTRLLNLGVPGYLIQQTILGVMAQRLIRVLCRQCKTATEVDEAQWQALVAPFKVASPKQIYKAVGCKSCRNTGFAGRIGIYEIFENNPALQKLIVTGCDTLLLQRQAIREGMRPLRLSGAEKVAAGITTMEEVLRVAPEQIDF